MNDYQVTVERGDYGAARWTCTCGKNGPWMLYSHAEKARRWHQDRHDRSGT